MIDRLRHSFGFGFIGLLLAGLFVPLTSCISSPSLTSITVTPTTMNFGGPGLTTQLTAMGSYTHPDHPAVFKDITNQVTWTSATPGCVTVNATGLITSQNATCSNILVTASAQGYPGLITGSMTVNVTGSVNTSEPITAVTIVPATLSVAAPGQTGQFIAIGTVGGTGLQVNLTSQVAWSSSSSSVATIGATTGLATAVGAGTSNITAIWTNPDKTIVTGTAAFTVTGAAAGPLLSLSIIPNAQTMAAGQTSQLIAIGTFSTSPTSQDLTSSVTWSSSNTSVASISSGGLVTAKAPGTAAITAVASNFNGAGSVVTTTATFTVSSSTTVEPLVSMAILPASQTALAANQTAQFIAIGTTSSGTTVNLTDQSATVGSATIAPANWQSSNQSVATIDPLTGIATAHSAGTTAITATAINPVDQSVVIASSVFTVSVSASPEPIVSMTILPGSQTANSAGQAIQYIAIGTTSSGATVDLTSSATWISSSGAIASFSKTTPGLATAVANGATAIIATAPANPGNYPKDPSLVSAAAALTVNITAASEPYVSLSIVPGSQTIAMGQTAKFLAIGTTGTGATVDLTSQATWKVSNGSVASIGSNSGIATPIATGATAITATFANPGINGNPPDGTSVTGTAALTVSATPEPLVSLAIVPASQTALGVNQPSQFIAIGTTASGATVNLTNQTATIPSVLTGQVTIQPATWQSSNSNVASFPLGAGNTPNVIGIATSQGAGTTAITASAVNPDGSVVVGTAVYTVTIPAVVEPYVSLAIVPSSQTITTGQSAKFLAIGTTGTGATVDLTSQATWKVTNGSVASIGLHTGIASPLAAGATAITATFANPGIGSNPPDGTSVTATAALTVTVPTVVEPYVSLAIVPGSQTVAVGQTANFLAIGTTSSGTTVDLTSQATWKVSNGSVASIGLNSGIATPIAAGATAVTATFANPGINGNPPDGTSVKGTAALTVSSTPEPLVSLTIVPASQTALAANQQAQFIAIGTTASGATVNLTNQTATIPSVLTGQVTIQPATWQSSNSNVASFPLGVGNTPNVIGIATSQGAGTTAITASAVNPDGSVVIGTAVYTVTIPTVVEPYVSLTIVPASQTVAMGQTAKFLAIGTTGTGATVDLTSQATWKVSNGSVASVGLHTGIATPIATGTTAITATFANPGIGSNPPDGTSVTGTAALTVSATPEPLVSLAIVPASQTALAANQQVQFIAIGTTASGATVNLTDLTATIPSVLTGQVTIQPATWQSSNSNVASFPLGVGNTPNVIGIATSQGAGTTAITASATNPDGTVVVGTAVFTVTIPAVVEPYVSLSIVPNSQTIAVGQTAKFLAIGTTGTGATVDLTSQATWKVSNGSVASIGLNTGIATPIAAGATAITATFANPGIGTNPPDGTSVTGTAVLTVSATPEPLVSLAIVPASQTALAANQQVQFIAIGTTASGATVNLTDLTATIPSALTGQVTIQPATWQSSNSNVASFPLGVGNTPNVIGIATSQGAGTTAITASATNPDGTVVVGTAVFTVTIPTVVEPYVSLAIVPASQTVAMGQTAKFLAIGTTGAGATVDLTSQATWKVSNGSVASIGLNTGIATPIAAGATAITATFANPGIGSNPPDGTSVTGTAALTVSLATEPLVSLSIVPASQSVASPGQSSQLLAIGTFSAAPITQDVTNGLASPAIKTNWSSSNTSVATVTTACPTGLVATSCTISACPGTSSGGSCTSCPGGTTASGGSCATLNPTTPMGVVTGVNQGTAAIVVEAANPDTSLVTGTAPFTVVGAATEQITAVQIIPNTLTATSPAEKNQLIALGTEGSTGLQFDVTNQVVWVSNNSPVASICTAVAGVAPSPVTPISCPSTPGLVTAATAGTTNITATWTNLDGTKVVAQSTYTVTIGSSPEPLISINVVPTSTTVTNKGMTQQFLAFGTYTTIPTVRDITDTVTWISLSPNNASINSAGTPGEIAGLATAQGYEGPGVIYAEDTTTNPDGTLVLSNPVTFSCIEPGTSPPICNQAVAPSLLATLTVFNAGSNSTNWLITAPSDNQATCNATTGCLIHCGPGSEIAGYGNSVCTGTYAAGTSVTITASLAGVTLDTTFGGWTANCDTVADTPNMTANCALPTPSGGGDPSGLVGNQSVGALFYGLSLSCPAVTSGTVGVAFNSGAATASGGTPPYVFSVVGTLPAGLTLNTTTGAVTGTPTATGSFSLTATDTNGTNAATTCAITIN